ncbi:Polyprenol reductase [Golovinomyces cichoracearum]|uniref:Polyprenal reductase n=1 Tax=Golovinomyces cichoracearum TaxID=62708 RepID=A0A420HUU1_9PEZI|nr:Polyprenol reductase [Golovinomyces cichoracearum]
MDPSTFCRLFFTSGVLVCLGGVFITPIQSHIMAYGSRSTFQLMKNQQRSLTGNLFNKVASLRVPHSWFTHYYVASVISSFFWLFQIVTHGSRLRYLATLSKYNGVSMSVNQVLMSWLLMTIQGVRRLLESLTLTKESQSQMWIGIWILGIFFYLVMGIAIWIEGIASLDREVPVGNFLSLLSLKNPKTYIALAIFVIASVAQNICHRHLFNLKKYSLPQHRFFRYIVCPHYTCECLIYLSIALASAPEDRIFNSTILTGLAFVVANLAVTADGTYRFYKERFGTKQMENKWRMMSLLY